MNSNKCRFKIPNNTMALFSGIPEKLDSQFPAMFLADSPLILCNFETSAWHQDFLMRHIVAHEILHRHFIFEFIPLQAYFWIEIHNLEAFQRFIEKRCGEKVLKVDPAEMKDFAPIALLDLPKYFPSFSDQFFTLLSLICEGSSLLEHLFTPDAFPSEERVAFLEEWRNAREATPEYRMFSEMFMLHASKNIEFPDLLTMLNMAALRSPHEDPQFDDFSYILKSEMLLDSTYDTRLRALGSLLTKGCLEYLKITDEKNFELDCSEADKILYGITDALYLKCVRYVSKPVLISPLPLVILNLASAIFTSFYGGYACIYVSDDRFRKLQTNLWVLGGTVTPAWFRDGLMMVGDPKTEDLLKHSAKVAFMGDDGDLTVDRLPEMAALSWINYLFSRTIRRWLAGKQRKLVCPIYEFFKPSLKENKGRLHEFCQTDSQSETFCCVATSQLDLESVRKMKCPFGEALSDIFNGFDLVQIVP
ncbi:hypothetical protein MYX82_10965 [Acidobacteria bacterium AH-259-D05]|nr:hypothetical protein [Acidobacteria bacterium AH-259-D05]